MPVIYFGNVATIERPRDDDGKESIVKHPPTITSYGAPDDWSVSEVFNTFVAANGAWEYHSSEAPAWVECDDPFLAEMFSRHYGCPIGRPKDWDSDPKKAKSASK